MNSKEYRPQWKKKKNIVREEQIIDLFIIINPKGIRPCRLLEE